LFPVYNARPYLEASLASLLNQSYSDFVILALNDGSTDGSLDYLQSLSDPRVVISSSTENLGLGATLQRGLEHCQTPLFARMDADDLCDPERLRLQVAFLDRHPDIDMVGTQFHYFSDGGGHAMTPMLPQSHDDICESLLNGQLAIIHGSIAGRTQAMRAAGGYTLRGMGEDWDMFLRFGEVGRMANLDRDLYGYRYHAGNISFDHLQKQAIGIAYARDCASRRAAGEKEMAYTQFLAHLAARPWHQRLIDKLDVLALKHYRMAIAQLAENKPFRGRLNLLIGAGLAPKRAISRVLRDHRKRQAAHLPR